MPMEEENGHQFHLNKPLRCIVKLGGAAITCKTELEEVNEANLETVSAHLRQAMIPGKVIGMDWSKRPGQLGLICPDVGQDLKSSSMEGSNFIVVHGAGSFGHFQASKSGVHKGSLEKPLVKAGFVAIDCGPFLPPFLFGGAWGWPPAPPAPSSPHH